MLLGKEYELLQATPICGCGYAEPLYMPDANHSVFIDNKLERQSKIPGRSLEELKLELGLERT